MEQVGSSYLIARFRNACQLIFFGYGLDLHRVGFDACQFQFRFTFRFVRYDRVEVLHRSCRPIFDLRKARHLVHRTSPLRVIRRYRRMSFIRANYLVNKGRVSVSECGVLFCQVQEGVTQWYSTAGSFCPIRKFCTAKDRRVVRVVIVVFADLPWFRGEGVVT